MIPLPISSLTLTGFYFSLLLFFISTFILIGMYYFRWRSDLCSLLIWLIAIFGSALPTFYMTQDLPSLLIILGITLFFVLSLCVLKSVISLFGVFFLASMLLPSFFGLIWLYELMTVVSHFLNAEGPLQVFLILIEILFSLLMIVNSIIASWTILLRYSSLYFRFPRIQGALRQVKTAERCSPFVSIHIPCYNEPPEVVIATLNALADLNYPNFEVIVLDNNTKDAKVWMPVEIHCQKLGEQFRFYHIDSLPGAKAGALNYCLTLTSKQMEYVSVLDADYVVQPNFLNSLIPFFDDPKVGFVQGCQDYRNWEHNPYQTACYYEYQPHFKLVLTGQNEWDMAYTIGTLCIFRRNLLEKAGGWADWCLTEDSEIAVRIHALGYSGYYLKDTFGYGLIPETFENYKQQRFRWSAGPVQQFQKHWRLYLPFFSKGQLTFPQKLGEISHSLSNFFSEAMNLFMNLPILIICLWLMIEKQYSFPVPTVLLIFIPMAMIKNTLFNWLAVRLLGGSWKNYFLSAIAVRSLIFIRNLALYKALFSKNLKWQRTDKFKAASNFSRAIHSSRPETISTLVYLMLVVILIFFVNFQQPDIIFIIWLGLINRVLTFVCAPIMAFFSEKCLDQYKIKFENDDKSAAWHTQR